jgi:hypothetical protein
MASPPEPANSLINMTFGPKIAPCGSTSSPPSRADAGQQFAVEELDDVGGQRTAAVEPFVDDDGLLVDRRRNSG